jgi:hypothetical protein
LLKNLSHYHFTHQNSHILIFHDFITVPGMSTKCVVPFVSFPIPQLFRISILGVLYWVKIEHLIWWSSLCVLTKFQCLNHLERFYCLISAGDLLELVRDFQFSAIFVHITQGYKETSYVYHKPWTEFHKQIKKG